MLGVLEQETRMAHEGLSHCLGFREWPISVVVESEIRPMEFLLKQIVLLCVFLMLFQTE